MKFLFENWRGFINEGAKYQAVQRFLDDLPTSVATDGMGVDSFREFKELYPYRRVKPTDFFQDRLIFPEKLLRAKVSEKSLTLYRGSSISEWEQAMTGEVAHEKGKAFSSQFGSVKYMTDNLSYAQNWGYVIVYEFFGKLLGPVDSTVNVREFRNPVDSYIKMLLRRGNLWEKHPNLCDGVYGPELGVPGVMTYGIENLTSLTVDVAKSKMLSDL